MRFETGGGTGFWVWAGKRGVREITKVMHTASCMHFPHPRQEKGRSFPVRAETLFPKAPPSAMYPSFCAPVQHVHFLGSRWLGGRQTTYSLKTRRLAPMALPQYLCWGISSPDGKTVTTTSFSATR